MFKNKPTVKPGSTETTVGSPPISRPEWVLPPFSKISSTVKLSGKNLSSGTVTMPAEAFALLLERAFELAGFDEAEYLAQHQDVAAAVKAGKVRSGLAHYARSGYVEGRKVKQPRVDDQWYAEKYPDVASAVKNYQFPTVQAHYDLSALSEARSPNERADDLAKLWKTAKG